MRYGLGVWLLLTSSLLIGACDSEEPSDSGVVADGAVAVRDASLPDGSVPDASLPDGSLPDASLPDGSLPDASLRDAMIASPDASVVPSACDEGVVTYGVGGEHFRTTLGPSASTENLTDALDALAPGADGWVAVSPDGAWLLIDTDRFDSACDGWSCLAVLPADLSSGETVRIDGAVLHADRYSAIASGGRRIVYSDDAGAGQGLFVIDRGSSGWSEPRLLTTDSPATYNVQPALSADGSRVLFDCGEDVYSQPPTSICEVGTDGTGFRVVWTPERGADGVAGRADVALHSPDYAPDGSIVFEADWSGEQIWRLSGDGPPVRISGAYSNDNSPCVLANGCVVSLWLERPGSSGDHELKIMDSAGGDVVMLRTGVDVIDTGLGCGR